MKVQQEFAIATGVHPRCKTFLNSNGAESFQGFSKYKLFLEYCSIQCEQIPFVLLHLCWWEAGCPLGKQSRALCCISHLPQPNRTQGQMMEKRVTNTYQEESSWEIRPHLSTGSAVVAPSEGGKHRNANGTLWQGSEALMAHSGTLLLGTGIYFRTLEMSHPKVNV